MNSYQREQRIARDIQLAISKLNHLTQLLDEIKIQVDRCQDIITNSAIELNTLKESTHEYN